ncbi:hypothetical protein HK100_000164 [Physocladia obscura]|uniref:Uncharacterized protein n=1 Tax=Physocladia obscura TaxID=109957 RepID=A0AAD5XC04_9FUNG|nr:hypothetical protein HK100_000164 [Physocladia obscura]
MKEIHLLQNLRKFLLNRIAPRHEQKYVGFDGKLVNSAIKQTNSDDQWLDVDYESLTGNEKESTTGNETAILESPDPKYDSRFDFATIASFVRITADTGQLDMLDDFYDEVNLAHYCSLLNIVLPSSFAILKTRAAEKTAETNDTPQYETNYGGMKNEAEIERKSINEKSEHELIVKLNETALILDTGVGKDFKKEVVKDEGERVEKATLEYSFSSESKVDTKEREPKIQNNDAITKNMINKQADLSVSDQLLSKSILLVSDNIPAKNFVESETNSESIASDDNFAITESKQGNETMTVNVVIEHARANENLDNDPPLEENTASPHIDQKFEAIMILVESSSKTPVKDIATSKTPVTLKNKLMQKMLKNACTTAIKVTEAAKSVSSRKSTRNTTTPRKISDNKAKNENAPGFNSNGVFDSSSLTTPLKVCRDSESVLWQKSSKRVTQPNLRNISDIAVEAGSNSFEQESQNERASSTGVPLETNGASFISTAIVTPREFKKLVVHTEYEIPDEKILEQLIENPLKIEETELCSSLKNAKKSSITRNIIHSSDAQYVNDSTTEMVIDINKSETVANTIPSVTPKNKNAVTNALSARKNTTQTIQFFGCPTKSVEVVTPESSQLYWTILGKEKGEKEKSVAKEPRFEQYSKAAYDNIEFEELVIPVTPVKVASVKTIATKNCRKILAKNMAEIPTHAVTKSASVQKNAQRVTVDIDFIESETNTEDGNQETVVVTDENPRLQHMEPIVDEIQMKQSQCDFVEGFESRDAVKLVDASSVTPAKHLASGFNHHFFKNPIRMVNSVKRVARTKATDSAQLPDNSSKKGSDDAAPTIIEQEFEGIVDTKQAGAVDANNSTVQEVTFKRNKKKRVTRAKNIKPDTADPVEQSQNSKSMSQVESEIPIDFVVELDESLIDSSNAVAVVEVVKVVTAKKIIKNKGLRSKSRKRSVTESVVEVEDQKKLPKGTMASETLTHSNCFKQTEGSGSSAFSRVPKVETQLSSNIANEPKEIHESTELVIKSRTSASKSAKTQPEPPIVPKSGVEENFELVLKNAPAGLETKKSANEHRTKRKRGGKMSEVEEEYPEFVEESQDIEPKKKIWKNLKADDVVETILDVPEELVPRRRGRPISEKTNTLKEPIESELVQPNEPVEKTKSLKSKRSTRFPADIDEIEPIVELVEAKSLLRKKVVQPEENGAVKPNKSTDPSSNTDKKSLNSKRSKSKAKILIVEQDLIDLQDIEEKHERPLKSKRTSSREIATENENLSTLTKTLTLSNLRVLNLFAAAKLTRTTTIHKSSIASFGTDYILISKSHLIQPTATSTKVTTSTSPTSLVDCNYISQLTNAFTPSGNEPNDVIDIHNIVRAYVSKQIHVYLPPLVWNQALANGSWVNMKKIILESSAYIFFFPD